MFLYGLLMEVAHQFIVRFHFHFECGCNCGLWRPGLGIWGILLDMPLYCLLRKTIQNEPQGDKCNILGFAPSEDLNKPGSWMQSPNHWIFSAAAQSIFIFT